MGENFKDWIPLLLGLGGVAVLLSISAAVVTAILFFGWNYLIPTFHQDLRHVLVAEVMIVAAGWLFTLPLRKSYSE